MRDVPAIVNLGSEVRGKTKCLRAMRNVCSRLRMQQAWGGKISKCNNPKHKS